MKKLIILISIFCHGQIYCQTENNFVSNDSTKNDSLISPYNLKNRISDSSLCNDVKTEKIFKRIIDTLTDMGTVYDINVDWYWFLDDETLISVFNDGYSTKIFDNVNCARSVYYSTKDQNLLEKWVQIKVWNMRDSIIAKEACKMITNQELVSSYFGPQEWLCMQYNNILFLLCGGDSFFWDENGKYLQSIINYLLNDKFHWY